MSSPRHPLNMNHASWTTERPSTLTPPLDSYLMRELGENKLPGGWTLLKMSVTFEHGVSKRRYGYHTRKPSN